MHINGLNSKMKKEESVRVNHENMLLLQRLIKGRSTFNVNDWEASHKKR